MNRQGINYYRFFKCMIWAIFALQMGCLLSFSEGNVVNSSNDEIQKIYKRGVKKYLDGDNKGAIFYFKKVLSMDPSHQKSRNFLMKSTVEMYPQREKAIQKPKLKKQKEIVPAQPKIIKKKAKVFKKPPPPKKVIRPKKEIPAKLRPKIKTIVNTIQIDHYLFQIYSVTLVIVLFLLFQERRKIKIMFGKIRKFDEILIRGESEKRDSKRLQAVQMELDQKKRELNELKKEETKKRARELEKVRQEYEKKIERLSSAPISKPPPPPEMTLAQKKFVPKKKYLTPGVWIDAPTLKRGDLLERIANQSVSLFNTSSEEAIIHLRKVATDENPLIRASIVKALEKIAVPESLDLLLELQNDKNLEVRREVLKSLKNLRRNEAIPEPYQQKIKSILEEELLNGDWVL